MKRIVVLALLLSPWLFSEAQVQPGAVRPSIGRHANTNSTTLNSLPTPYPTTNLNMSAQSAPTNTLKVYDLGHYPGGTWAELHSVNDFGVAVGWGDVPSGDIRMVGVPIVGPNAGQWFEAGVSSNEVWSLEGVAISNTGIIAGHIKDAKGEARAYAWAIGDEAGIDLGSLPGDDGSAAIAINNSGTVIVGNSYHWLNKKSWWASPVAWTQEVKWHDGQTTTSWVIHALPTGGLEQRGKVFKGDVLNNWSGWGVNDLGQIAGDAWTDKYDEIAVVWNPVRGGQGWEIQQLPTKSSFPTIADYAYTEALSINNNGEIAGDISSDGWITTLPALWTVEHSKTYSWKLAELTTPSGGTAWGINDLGDVVGVSFYIAANGNALATRWLTSDTGNLIVIGFPGDYSRAMGVNNHGIVVGRYAFGVGTLGPMQAAAVAIH
jgi:uncharacterized membrane protein